MEHGVASRSKPGNSDNRSAISSFIELVEHVALDERTSPRTRRDGHCAFHEWVRCNSVRTMSVVARFLDAHRRRFVRARAAEASRDRSRERLPNRRLSSAELARFSRAHVPTALAELYDALAEDDVWRFRNSWFEFAMHDELLSFCGLA